MSNAARQPIEFGHNEGVAFPHVFQCAVELVSRSDRRNLFVEDLVTAERLQSPKLSLEPGFLMRCRGACIADDGHGISSLPIGSTTLWRWPAKTHCGTSVADGCAVDAEPRSIGGGH